MVTIPGCCKTPLFSLFTQMVPKKALKWIVFVIVQNWSKCSVFFCMCAATLHDRDAVSLQLKIVTFVRLMLSFRCHALHYKSWFQWHIYSLSNLFVCYIVWKKLEILDGKICKFSNCMIVICCIITCSVNRTSPVIQELFLLCFCFMLLPSLHISLIFVIYSCRH